MKKQLTEVQDALLNLVGNAVLNFNDCECALVAVALHDIMKKNKNMSSNEFKKHVDAEVDRVHGEMMDELLSDLTPEEMFELALSMMFGGRE